MNYKLEPCPFCGEEVMMYDTGNHYPKTYYRVLCKKYCCMQAKFYETPQEAAQRWNRRTPNE